VPHYLCLTQDWRVQSFAPYPPGTYWYGSDFAAVFSLPEQWLLNTVVASAFGLPQITQWQALGLIILSRLPLGGLGWKSQMASCRPHTQRTERGVSNSLMHGLRVLATVNATGRRRAALP